MKFRTAQSPLFTLALIAGVAHAQYTVELKDAESTYPAEAVVEAIKQATVAAQLQGRVVEVRADAGQRVKQGEVLMRLDAREAAEGAAGSQAQYLQAKAQYERSKNLHAQKFISQASLDQAEATFKAAQATAGASGATLSHATVTAPISGIVAQRHTELGEMASPGKPLITVFDPKGLRVTASVPQYKLAEVRKASRAKVEFPETGVWVDAAKVEVLPTADARTHAVTARVYLPDDLQNVIPGMFARVHFITGQAKKLTVPTAAVMRRGEVSALYVLGEGGPRLRQVRLGEPVAGGDLEVLAGLSAGEKISLDPVKTGIELRQATVKK